MAIGGCGFVRNEKVESLLLTRVFLARKLTIDGKIRDEVLESGIELQENNVSP